MALVDFSFLFKPSLPSLPLFSFLSCCPPSLQLHLSYSLLRSISLYTSSPLFQRRSTFPYILPAIAIALSASLITTLGFVRNRKTPSNSPHLFPQKSTLRGSQHLRPLQCLNSHQRNFAPATLIALRSAWQFHLSSRSRSTTAQAQAIPAVSEPALISDAKKDGGNRPLIKKMAAPQPPVSPPPRRSRGFSVKSDNSRRTTSSGHKSHLSESHEEKERRNLHTKADPLVAMNELQPSAF